MEKSVHLVMSVSKEVKMLEVASLLYEEVSRNVPFKATTVKKDDSGMRTFNATIETNLMKALKGDNLQVIDLDIMEHRCLHLPTLTSIEFKDTLYMFIDDVIIGKMLMSSDDTTVNLGKSLKQLMAVQKSLVNSYNNMLG